MQKKIINILESGTLPIPYYLLVSILQCDRQSFVELKLKRTEVGNISKICEQLFNYASIKNGSSFNQYELTF